MKINTNISSMITQRYLQTTQKALARSLARLSSGKRVNSAKDDPASLSVAARFESQLRGFAQVGRDVNRAMSLLNNVDSALGTQIDMVQRMRELAVQASNGTLSTNDREAIQRELNQILEEFDGIANRAEFDSTKLLDGSFGTKNILVGLESNQSIDVGIEGSRAIDILKRTVGSGAFKFQQTVGVTFAPVDVEIGDFNNDGHMDLATNNFGDALSVLIGRGDGTFKNQVTYAIGTASTWLAVGDVNGDDKLDLVSSDTGEISVLLGRGDGTFQNRLTLAIAGASSEIRLQDINGDGLDDIATTTTTNDRIEVFLSYGNGHFSSAITTAVSGSPGALNLVDFNNDGKLDAFYRDNTEQTISIMLGNGNGTFGARATLLGETGIRSLEAADFNNDGKIDLVAGGSTNDRLSVYFGNGNGGFGAATNYSATDPWGLVLNDVNGDGYTDLVYTQRAQHGLGVRLNNGNGTFGAESRYTSGVSNGPNQVKLGDFNSDGVLDAVTANSGVNDLGIFLAIPTEKYFATDFSVADQEKAQNLIGVADEALERLLERRSNISSLVSRLERVVDSSLVLSESIAEARSQLLDTNYAEEMAEFVRNQIMQQAGVLVLGQANFSLQVVLQLLRN